MGDSGAEGLVTSNRCRGDRRPDGRVTGSRFMGEVAPDAGDIAVDSSGTSNPKMGDWGPIRETVGVRDMGDARSASSADALENDVSHG